MYQWGLWGVVAAGMLCVLALTLGKQLIDHDEAMSITSAVGIPFLERHAHFGKIMDTAWWQDAAWALSRRSIASVFASNESPGHLPLYFALIHLLAGPANSALAAAMIVNIISIFLTATLLYRLSTHILQLTQMQAAAAAGFWLLYPASLGIAEIARPYALLACLWALLLNLVLENKTWRGKHALIALVSTTGALLHTLFVLALISLLISAVLEASITRGRPKSWLLVWGPAVGVVVGLCLLPIGASDAGDRRSIDFFQALFESSYSLDSLWWYRLIDCSIKLLLFAALIFRVFGKMGSGLFAVVADVKRDGFTARQQILLLLTIYSVLHFAAWRMGLGFSWAFSGKYFALIWPLLSLAGLISIVLLGDKMLQVGILILAFYAGSGLAYTANSLGWQYRNRPPAIPIDIEAAIIDSTSIGIYPRMLLTLPEDAKALISPQRDLPAVLERALPSIIGKRLVYMSAVAGYDDSSVEKQSRILKILERDWRLSGVSSYEVDFGWKNFIFTPR